MTTSRTMLQIVASIQSSFLLLISTALGPQSSFSAGGRFTVSK